MSEGEVRTIVGTSLGMEMSRMGRRRKLVVYVKFWGDTHWYPHYILNPPL
jgi:hypothetical protein